MRPYSTDLRERVAVAVAQREGSLREIAHLFRASLPFVVRSLQRRREAGTFEPKPHDGDPLSALGPDGLRRLAELIRDQPDAPLRQRKERGGLNCSLKTLWYAVRRRGLTLKKSLNASERGRPDVETK